MFLNSNLDFLFFLVKSLDEVDLFIYFINININKKIPSIVFYKKLLIIKIF